MYTNMDRYIIIEEEQDIVYNVLDNNENICYYCGTQDYEVLFDGLCPNCRLELN